MSTAPAILHRRRITCLALLAISLVSIGFSQFSNFVTVKGARLMDGDRVLRFISVNIPNLHYLEDYLPFTGTNPWRLPDEFEIRDALLAVKQMGGKVARTYVLSVRREDDTPDIPRHVQGPGEFNEAAFRTLDTVLQIANEVGIRVIIPFVDNWQWWGGPREYAAFRGKAKEEFYTDPQLIDDFKKTIAFVLLRKNTATGTLYREDKAILAWETGNELDAPFSWTKEIAETVKSLDANHLLMEGTFAKELSQEALDDPNLDILSTHHYGDPRASLSQIVKNQQLARGKKPYIVGEYGIVPTEDIRVLTDTIIAQGLAGGLLWSLRYRSREGGFYYHYEYNNTAAYRWPGFANGDFYDERGVLALLREKAWEIDGAVPPRLPVPAAPFLLDIRDTGEIFWQGSVGASAYVVERRTDQDTSWTVVGAGVDESGTQYRPLFIDETAHVGTPYFYRVRAKNDAGTSASSNVVGPVVLTMKTFVDEMEDFTRVYQKDGPMQLLVSQDLRKAREDRSRLTGAAGSYLVYRVPPSLHEFHIDALGASTDGELRLLTSADGITFAASNSQKEIFSFRNNDYGFFHAIRISLKAVPPRTAFVRVVLDGSLQIGRIEYTYR